MSRRFSVGLLLPFMLSIVVHTYPDAEQSGLLGEELQRGFEKQLQAEGLRFAPRRKME